MVEKRESFARDFDHLRRAIVCEPRGHDAIVGALLTEPCEEGADTGVIYFNNTGMLGMCGHGTIGVIATLKHIGVAIEEGVVLDTPAGLVAVESLSDSKARIRNIPSYRHLKDVSVDVPGHGTVTGDVAWGGNWFFLCSDHGQDLSWGRQKVLTQFCIDLNEALVSAGIAGKDAPIDHIDLFGPPMRDDAQSRNFVLCPGFEYDRSPCGTGLSAKLACLAADGLLAQGEVWRQEGFAGGVFDGSWEPGPLDTIIPIIEGSAWISAHSELIFDPNDPFRHGIGP
jgi:4-hydroxyproline epimerase